MPEQTAGAGSNRIWYIVGAVAVLLLLAWVMTRAGTGTSVTPSAGGGTTYTNEEGTATVGGTTYPESWPSDAPRYGNGSLQYSGSSNPQTGSAGAAIMFTTSDSAQTVIDFYKAELTKSGWTIESTASANGALVLAAEKDTRTFGVWAATVNGQTTVTAGVSGE